MVHRNHRSAHRIDLDDRLLPMVRRIIVALLYDLGALLAMDQLGINISPLIAGMGLGGLAVALARQPTLANLFSGTYAMTEGVVTPGDYVQLVIDRCFIKIYQIWGYLSFVGRQFLLAT